MSTDYRPLPEMLKATAQRFSGHTAIRFGERHTDFATFDDQSDRVAAALAGHGIRKGDRIGLYCINSDFFAVAYFGIVKAGATVVPLNLLLNPEEIAYVLNDAGARGLIYHEAMSQPVAAVRQQVTHLDFVSFIGTQPVSGDDVPFTDLLAHEGVPPDITFDPGEDLVSIIYTSGTTGYPKGAMLTHRNLASNTRSIGQALCLEPGRDVLLVVLPMFHAFAATVGMLFPLLHGCTFVPLPRFDPELVANTIEHEKATLFMGVPSMYSVLMRLPEAFTAKFSSLTLCVSGGAAMPVELMKQFEARFGKAIYEGDGPTECSPVTCVNPIGGTRKPASVGLPVPDVEMCIRDENGQELPDGEIGEICVRGPNVMKGYWNREEDTRTAFFGEWFRTGDLGNRDEDGYFYILDRIKDMIIVNGMNVYPRIVEEVIYRHPAVAEAAVVGEPHKMHGEIPVAHVALKESGEATAADLRAFCRNHLGQHEVPRKVFFLPQLPKNAAGKIVKRELRKQGEVERGVQGNGHV